MSDARKRVKLSDLRSDVSHPDDIYDDGLLVPTRFHDEGWDEVECENKLAADHWDARVWR